MKRVNIFENTIKIKCAQTKPFGGEFLDNLFSQELYVEAFLYYCLEVEDKIKFAVRCQELAENMALKIEGFTFNSGDKNMEKPLGVLIYRLSLYCKDKELLYNLNNFNLLRKKVFHNLLYEDREKVNKEIKSNIYSFYSLINGLVVYGSDAMKRSVEMAVTKNQQKNHKKYPKA